MKRPTPPPDDFRDLIARCLQLYEERGPRAVDEVLASHPDSSDFVRERLDLLGRMGLIGEAPEDATPERIGDYRIIGVLGRGGMGVVYEAEQERPRRRVALKVLRSWPGEKGRRRLEHEAELLARLQHPGIATIHEVGTARVGGMSAPFFAMELVRGIPVDRYADESGLDARERIALLARIADAVHHAHLKGVVHRDLKPANVIVDERGEPRVLDFGIARAIDPDLQLETLRTEVGQLVGTLAYMSPEQAAGDPDEVDARSDVYALGVMGYELLAGRLPVEVEGRSALDALKSIRDDDPPPLGQLDRALRGDVETIFATALAKEKERRYASAHELAADIRHHLSDEPIAARPATAAYQLGKLARRHRALVAGAAAAVLALVLGLAGTSYGLLRAARERVNTTREHAAAERRFHQASAVLAFQSRMFATADPGREGITVADLLDRGTLLLQEASDDPVEQAAVQFMLGDAYAGIGEYPAAEPLISSAIEVFERELGPADLQTLSARAELASLLGKPMGRLDEAERALEGVVETATRVHGASHETTLRARLVRTDLEFERGRFQVALDTAREVERLAAPDRAQWVPARKLQAKSLKELGQDDAALEIAREIHDRRTDTLGSDHPSTWGAMDTLGAMLQNTGRYEEGAEIMTELLELRELHLGPEHPDTLNAKTNVAQGLHYLGQYDLAAELLEEALETCDRTLRPGHPARLFVLNTLATVYIGRHQEHLAEPMFRELIEHARVVHGPEHPNTLTAMTNLSVSLRRTNRAREAEQLLVDVLEIRRREIGSRHRETLTTCVNLGFLYTKQGRLADGEALLREAVDTGRDALGPEDATVAVYMKALGENLILQQRFAEAGELLVECRAWIERAYPADPLGPVVDRLIEHARAQAGGG